MTDQHQERLYWDAAASDPANIGGIGMPPVEHFLAVLERFETYDCPDMLDLGCGPGRLSVPMAFRGYVHGVDVSQKMLSRVPPHRYISTHLGDGRTIPDTVPPIGFGWSVLMFQHIPRRAFADYMYAVAARLKPGARFVAQWVRHGPEHDYSHPTSGSMGAGFGSSAGLELVEAWRDGLVPEWFWACWEKP